MNDETPYRPTVRQSVRDIRAIVDIHVSALEEQILSLREQIALLANELSDLRQDIAANRVAS
jgi:hypothetical protein